MRCSRQARENLTQEELPERLELAAALVARPEVLFLDEPAVRVRPRVRGLVWLEVLERVKENTAAMPPSRERLMSKSSPEASTQCFTFSKSAESAFSKLFQRG